METHILTKKTETQNLIGTSTLDDKDKLSKYIEYLMDKVFAFTAKSEFRNKNEEDKEFVNKNRKEKYYQTY